MTLTKLYEYPMLNVFRNEDHEIEDEAGKGLEFSEYLQALFVSLGAKIDQVKIEAERKERLVLDSFIAGGMT